jgi:hypothetical protein
MVVGVRVAVCGVCGGGWGWVRVKGGLGVGR